LAAWGAALIPGRRTIVSTGRRGVGTAPTADVGVARADHAVVDVVIGLDVDGAPGLDDGGVALVATGVSLKAVAAACDFYFR